MYPTSYTRGPFRSLIPCYQPAYFYVYLLHFSRRYHHAGHYLGVTCDLDARLARHARGDGARLMEVIVKAGIEWEVCRLWRFDTWEEAAAWERKLKKWQMSPRLCPTCQGKPVDDLVFMRQGHWPLHLFKQGKRRPMK